MVKTINAQAKTKSVHYLKDLAYLQLSLGFINQALEDMVQNPPKDSSLVFANYELIAKFKKILDSRYFFFTRLTTVDSRKKDDFAKKILKQFTKAGAKLKVSINIELFAIYILYARYSDNRQKYLHEDFQVFADNKYLFEIASLICELEQKEDEGVEYFLAYDLAKGL